MTPQVVAFDHRPDAREAGGAGVRRDRDRADAATKPAEPTRAAAWRASTPVPQATSRTRLPGATPAASSTWGGHCGIDREREKDRDHDRRAIGQEPNPRSRLLSCSHQPLLAATYVPASMATMLDMAGNSACASLMPAPDSPDCLISTVSLQSLALDGPWRRPSTRCLAYLDTRTWLIVARRRSSTIGYGFDSETVHHGAATNCRGHPGS